MSTLQPVKPLCFGFRYCISYRSKQKYVKATLWELHHVSDELLSCPWKSVMCLPLLDGTDAQCCFSDPLYSFKVLQL